MAKSVSDLATALKPIQAALAKLSEDTTSTNTQIAEMHSMLTNLCVRMDTLEQTTGAALSNTAKAPAKRATGGRKPAVKKTAAPKKAPLKRGAKKAEASDEEEEAAESVAEDEEEAAESVAEDDAEDDAEDEEETPAETTGKKAVVKVGVPVKKGKKPAAEKKPAAPRAPNKMNLFKETFKSSPETFDKYLTAKVKAQIAKDNKDKWEDLAEDKLATQQCMAYYHYMKDKHDDVLEGLKNKSDE